MRYLAVLCMFVLAASPLAPADLFGQSFLTNVATVDYSTNDHKWTVFVARYASHAAANDAFGHLNDYVGDGIAQQQADLDGADSAFAGQMRYHGEVLVARQGRLVAGGIELDDTVRSAGEKTLRRVLRRLPHVCRLIGPCRCDDATRETAR